MKQLLDAKAQVNMATMILSRSAREFVARSFSKTEEGSVGDADGRSE